MLMVTQKIVYNPEIPVNIYDLGVIYEITRPEAGMGHIKMTLTASACPVAGTLPGQVETVVSALDDVDQCIVELAWDSPCNWDLISEEAKLQ